MNSSKYLPIGSNIAKKYEVVDVLGEDEFEILYLVRDLHRKGSFFVLKELFLETFSCRVGQAVSTVAEAKGVFDKRKKQIIEEMDMGKLNLNLSEIRIYGYEEDNDTIYSIMEFSNNASLERYLQFIPKDTKHLPTLNELVEQENKTINYSFFFKIFLILGLISAIAFYAYEYFKKDSMEENFIKLEKSANISSIKLKDRTKTIEVNKSIEKIEFKLEVLTKEINLTSVVIKNLPKVMESEENVSVSNEVVEKLIVEKNITTINVESLELLNVTEVNNTTIQMRIKTFLDDYMNSSSSASVGDTLKYYDKQVTRYFKLKNVTQNIILEGQEKYNKKWINRRFEIVDFEIMEKYIKDNANLYDLKTITVWNVSNSKGRKASGRSMGFMTVKELDNTFKITSIYTLK